MKLNASSSLSLRRAVYTRSVYLMARDAMRRKMRLIAVARARAAFPGNLRVPIIPLALRLT